MATPTILDPDARPRTGIRISIAKAFGVLILLLSLTFSLFGKIWFDNVNGVVAQFPTVVANVNSNTQRINDLEDLHKMLVDQKNQLDRIEEATNKASKRGK